MQSKLHHKNICKIPLSVEPIQGSHFTQKGRCGSSLFVSSSSMISALLKKIFLRVAHISNPIFINSPG